MISYLVIGLCIVLLLAVIIISAKPISMGIEARREVKKDNNSDIHKTENEELSEMNILNNDISMLLIDMSDVFDPTVLYTFDNIGYVRDVKIFDNFFTYLEYHTGNYV